MTLLTRETTDAAVTTPTVRTTARRALFWVGILLIAVLFALAYLGLAGAKKDAHRLDATDPSPSGSKAVAEVLRQQGVTVTATSTLTATTAAIANRATTTLVVYDEHGYLDADQLANLADKTDHLILLEPSFAALKAVLPGVSLAGFSAKKTFAADCSISAVQRAATVSASGAMAYRVTGSAGDATTCLGSGGGAWSLVRQDLGTTSIEVLGATSPLTNAAVTASGNAALALGLLGEQPSLVWYLPSLADVASTGTPTFADLSPAWVLPVTGLLGILALVAVFWRARRFGPLVVENLPVVVRASETMEGRGRLYQKGSARTRALDALRIGAIDRLGRLCGLPRIAGVEEIIATVAEVTARPIHEVRGLLLDARPRSDSELVHLSDQLLTLERDVAAATQPS